MKTIEAIIAARGGLEWLKKDSNYIQIENPGFMRLCIEYVGEGPRGLPLVSVAHYGEQNGDAMRDPEIVFELFAREADPQFGPLGVTTWYPVSIQQDYIGSYQDIIWKDRCSRSRSSRGRSWSSPACGTVTSRRRGSSRLPSLSERSQRHDAH